MKSVLVGWFCTLLHDFPEPEQRLMLPSSKFTDEWEVRSVNDENMSLTAIKPNASALADSGEDRIVENKGEQND